MNQTQVSSEQYKERKVNVRFSQSEWERLLKMAKTTGKSLATLLRESVLSQQKLVQPFFSHEETTKFMTELNRQGNNLNQIAKKMNSEGGVSWFPEFKSMTRAYFDLRHMIAQGYGNR